MLVKVILKKSMAKLGKAGEIVKIARGYKNYLLANGLAISATKSNEKELLEQKETLVQKDKEHYEDAVKLKEKLSQAHLVFLKDANSEGRLFGSINNKQILDGLKIKYQVVELLPNQLRTDKTIKELGIYKISADLHSGVTAEFAIIVATSQNEANRYLQQVQKVDAPIN